MKKTILALCIAGLVMACSTSPTGDMEVFLDAQPRLVRTCPQTPCYEGYYSVLNCTAINKSGGELEYSFDVSPPGAGVNQPNPHNGFGIFEATLEGQYAVVCTVKDSKGNTGNAGLTIKVCDNCNR